MRSRMWVNLLQRSAIVDTMRPGISAMFQAHVCWPSRTVCISASHIWVLNLPTGIPFEVPQNAAQWTRKPILHAG